MTEVSLPRISPMTSKLVQLAVFDGFQLLDLAGPADVFNAASLLGGGELYTVETVALEPGPVRAFSGIEVNASRALADGSYPIDTLLVAGGSPSHFSPAHEGLVERIRLASRRARRVGSVCSGAFLLAQAGLLRHRRVTTHWAGSSELREQYPDTLVEPDHIFVQDGSLWTSAGVSAGIDLALAMVTADYGPELAREVSRWLVVYLHRPGGQSQFSVPIAAGPIRSEPLQALQVWIEENLAADLSLEGLAQQAQMSTRNLSRVFAAQFGMTPARYVEAVRVGAARRLLETTDQPVDRVGAAVGLRRPETLYRSFRRIVGVAPGQYRARFSRLPAPPAASQEIEVPTSAG